ncbi:MAG TPA: universal stress protein [Chthoniobacteraceae bacterium]|jgi:nucleotide-binding universal stress UspA family protein|nr:universal stress protein [Chthoniobacteraceae bacterium]
MKSNETFPIVCGTDFSENAQQAANVAAALAKRHGAPLVLVHAKGTLIHASTPDVNDALITSLRDALHAEAARLRALGATVEEILSDGPPDDALVQLAQDRHARLLVVSSLGSRASTRWLIGSVAERVAESSPVPTLVVREAARFEAWARGEQPLKVFIGTDFGASSDAALRWVSDLRQLGPCEVIAGYVAWPPEEASRLGVSAHVGLSSNMPEMQRMLERDLREKVARVLGEENVGISVRGNYGRADHPLLEMAIESHADVIVVGTHQWHGISRLQHGSVSRGILHHAPMNVACVPTSSAARMDGPRIRACQRVLVAVDLNEPHGFAAPYGYSIVNPGGTVRLLHNIVPLLALHRTDEKEPAQLVAESEAKLRALAPEKGEAPGITTEVEVTESGETAEAICAAAERFGADIVCIGSHTRPGFTAKVLGSVALAVLQTSRRPVLTVWPPAE